MKLLTTLLTLAFTLTFTDSSSQTSWNNTWNDIDSSILKKEKWSQLERRLDSMTITAFRNKDDINAARALFYTMRLRDRKYEDSLYFKNSAFTDSIINDNSSSTLLKSIMYIIKVQRLNQFKYSYRPNKKFPSGEEYVLMSPPQLDSLEEVLLQKAFSLAANIKVESIEELLWLSSDRYAFLYKPGLTDIIYLERVLLKARGNPITNDGGETWLTLSPSAFVNFSDTNLFTPIGRKIFLIYKEWIQSHQANPEAHYFIEMQSRNFFYNSLSNADAYAELYEEYLSGRLNTNFPSVKAYSVYQLCLMWYKLGDRYNPGMSRERLPSAKWDDKYKSYYTKAIDLFTRNEKLLDSFLMLKTILLEMKRQIEIPNVKIKAKDIQLPNQPVKAFVQFKNVQKLYTRLVPLNFEDFYPSKLESGWLAYKRFIKDTVIQMPGDNDYQWHNTLLNIGSLAVGKYAFLYSNMPFTEKLENTNYMILNITNIAIVQNVDRCFVLNRSTGFPIKDATVILSSTYKGKRDISTHNVGEKGEVVFKHDSYDSVLATFHGDSLKISSADLSVNHDIYDEDEYDDIAEYIEENTRVEIFKDRPIYRPGQKINFKGIIFSKDPRTGMPIVLTKDNQHLPFFKKVFSRFKKTKLDLLVTDPFNKEDTIQVFTNEYGSFSGSFTIPVNAPTGWWSFEHEELEMGYYNRETFEVEEYKKPGFHMKFEKPQKHLALGDSIPVKIKIKSFAGASLQRVEVNYQVTARVDISQGSDYKYRNQIILESTATTNENGEINFYITDSFFASIKKPSDKETRATYYIDADATDQQGETIDESYTIYLSDRPVQISATLPKIIDRKDLNTVNISTRSEYGGNLKENVAVSIYKIENSKNLKIDYQEMVDTWLYPADSITKWFGTYDKKEVDPEKKLLATRDIHTGTGELLLLPKELMEAGQYILELETTENGNLTGQKSISFEVFDSKTNETPQNSEPFYFLPKNQGDTENEIEFWSGSGTDRSFAIYQLSYFVMEKNRTVLKHHYEAREEATGLNFWKTKIPKNAYGDLDLQKISIVNNNLFVHHELIFGAKQKPSPEIIVEQYRKILVPGEKQQFVVSVKTDNLNTAAELMTTMYDASLEKIIEHSWNIPYSHSLKAESRWNTHIWTVDETELFRPDFEKTEYYFNASVWWNKEIEKIPRGIPGYSSNILQGRLAGVSVLHSNGLQEVVVVGYGTFSKRDLTGSVTVIRGGASLTGNNNALIVIDGIIYDKDLSDLNTAIITDILVLKGADAIAIYGSRGASGVVLLSTNGKVVLPQIPESQIPDKPINARKNFNDLAFFYPNIYANKDGLYTIQFTMPDNLTEWKWKMLAHTKSSQFASAERVINSQLKLMVEPAMPKFLYQGDRIRLKTRISNMDTSAVTGVLTCRIEDQVTGDDITSQFITMNNQTFSIGANGNMSASIELKVPGEQLNPLKIRVGFSTANLSDGEEHLMPVLSKSTLFSQAVPLNVSNAGITSIAMPDLPGKAKPYGVGLYIQPTALASMINSLSYLVDYPWICAEQTLNKMYASMIALHLMRTDSSVALGWEKSIASNTASLETDLPGEMDQNSMPWLKLNSKGNQNKKNLQKLFDTTGGVQQIQIHLEQLKELQQPNGGFSWFKGGEADPYISAYILNTFGKIRSNSLSAGLKNVNKLMLEMETKLISYVDSILSQPQSITNYTLLISARSKWIKTFPFSASLKKSVEIIIASELNKSYTYSLGKRARLINAALRLDSPGGQLYKNALENLESIRQMAISDKENGLRWKELSDSDDLNQSEEESIVSIAEAFEFGAKDQETVNGIIQWLLTNKREHYWTNTKATAEVIGLLAGHIKSIAGADKSLELASPNKYLSPDKLFVTNNLFTGALSDFALINNKQTAQAFQLKANADSTKGNINVYYFSETSPSTQTSDLSIKKTIYYLDRTTQQWTAVTDSTTLKIADKLKCDITITSGKLLQYVHIEDRVAASLDITDRESGYRYANRFSFYTSVREGAMQFFAEKIPSGQSTISYEMIVSKEGVFSYGPTALTCFYNPSLSVYGKPGTVTVVE